MRKIQKELNDLYLNYLYFVFHDPLIRIPEIKIMAKKPKVRKRLPSELPSGDKIPNEGKKRFRRKRGQ